MSSFVHMSNPYRKLKRWTFAAGIIVLSYYPAFTQQNWYVFIQSDNKQPFYARIDEKIYSSSSIGHLTIANLADSTYKIVIGFPKNQYREQTYTIPVNKKDHGYQLKKVNTQDWVLYNWQNNNTVKSLQSIPGNSLLYGERKTNDAFAGLMSAVVNDSAVLYTSVVRKPAVKKDTAKVVAKTDSVANIKKSLVLVDSVKKTDTAVSIPVPEKTTRTDLYSANSAPVDTVARKITADSSTTKTTAALPPAKETVQPAEKKEEQKTIIKLEEEQTKEGDKSLVFLDGMSIKGDTIAIVIPAEGKKEPEPKKEDPVVVKKDTIIAKDSTTVDETPVTRPKAVMSAPVTDVPAVRKDSVVKEVVKKEEEKKDSIVSNKADKAGPAESEQLIVVNSDCVNFATDNDIDKLRIKMLAAKDMGDRIFAAYKILKTKCFTTKQVRSLSELFSTDESKYRFYETAYPYVSDSARFKNLLDTFTDEFFITRFKTLVRMD